MKNYPATISDPNSRVCFVYENKDYRLTNNIRELPRIKRSYERLLQENNIHYEIKDGECEIYPEEYETEQLTFPVYAFHPLKGTYVVCENARTESFPTKATIERAELLLISLL